MGPSIRIVGRLHGARPMQSVNKYTDKDGSERKLPVSGQQTLESGGGRGGSKGRAFSLTASVPLPPLPWMHSCASHIYLGNHPLPYRTPLPLTLILLFRGGGQKPQPSIQHQIHEQHTRNPPPQQSRAGSPPYFNQVQNHCPRKRAREMGLWMWSGGVEGGGRRSERRNETETQRQKWRLPFARNTPQARVMII